MSTISSASVLVKSGLHSPPPLLICCFPPAAHRMKPLQLWLGFVASLRILSVYFGYLKPEMIQDGVFINAKDQGEDAPRVRV